MNCVSLDSVGIAGFSHTFDSLDGHQSEVALLFDSFTSIRPHSSLSVLLPLLSPVLPFLTRIPTRRAVLTKKLHESIAKVASVLLARSRSLEEEVRKEAGMSIIGALSECDNSRIFFSDGSRFLFSIL